MSFFYSRRDVTDRRPVVAGPLGALARTLSADLEGLRAVPLHVPREKALLSREGGRCPNDGAMLEFDPYSPRAHRCPVCGQSYSGETHDRFWIYWYQLWLAERAVHAAALGAVADDSKAIRLALDILDAYSTQYPKYPNVDNALGPTRPFFSTYLESIWLLQLCVAADLVETHSSSSITDRFRDAVVEPSVKLIRSFDEGLSNRQVWNNAALVAAYRLLGRDGDAESVVRAKSGVVAHLSTALLPDGTWYEGENYHFFAHRGLWYCMQIASRMNAEIPADLVDRYDAGFAAPFLTALPDLTFPSRRDSQYAVSLRQWRFAEMCELGLARGDNRILRGMLARLYADDIPRGDTGRWKSTAEAERNIPATRLGRSDLGWKSLLFARPTLEAGDAPPLPSVLLEGQGIGVIRRQAGRVYVALDYGVSGGGHGHPDRLNLMVSDGDRRILDDMGTGSYVDPSLHWYRSTLAHNAPMFDGRSQDRVDGQLLAFEDRGGAGWMSARAEIEFGGRVTRTVVAMPEYFVDEATWGAYGASKIFDLPLHMDLEPLNRSTVDGSLTLTGGDGVEDGFRFLREARCMLKVAPHDLTRLTGRDGDVWVSCDRDFEIWTALAPGAPGRPERRLTLLRSRVAEGTIRAMWSWTERPRATALFPNPVIETGGERHEHLRVSHGWQVAIHVLDARSTIDLEGQVSPDALEPKGPPRFSPPYVLIHTRPLANHQPIGFGMSERNYRGSEESWKEAGCPTADVTLQRDDQWITARIVVNAEPSFVPPGQENRLDNENADINGAGVQLYLATTDERRAAYVIVPRLGSDALSIRPIDGWGAGIPVSGSWSPSGEGYEVNLRFPCDGPGIRLDLIVNEKPAGRERRRGQLVLSGGLGQSIYLRGDRHDPHRLMTFNFE